MAPDPRSESMARVAAVVGDPGIPASTCLKWGADGDLTPTDLTSILARLCVHDPTACGLLACDQEPG